MEEEKVKEVFCLYCGIIGKMYSHSETALKQTNKFICDKCERIKKLTQQRNKLNREISKLKKVYPKEEKKEFVKVTCRYCNDELEVDLFELSYPVRAEVEFYIKKFGSGRIECDACKKAIKGWQQRTGTCKFCTKLARYDVEENFIECFGCGAKA